MVTNYLTPFPAKTIDEAIAALQPDKVIIVTDKNVEKLVIPKLQDSHIVSCSSLIALDPGEEHKNIDSVIRIWNKLGNEGATRQSVVLNIGGGMVTDLGGFAAATFKRGLKTINFPTTLLGAVDAATGGKTGINFNGLKNEIGAFHSPSAVILSTLPFATLSHAEKMSGYAEMVKTAIISDRKFYISLTNYDEEYDLSAAIEKCVSIKDDIVKKDPRENGLRKILNFGHTAGHAFESISISKGHPVSHGKAVAHGILVALILSHLILGFDSLEIAHYSRFLRENYGASLINCDEIEKTIEIMNRDKKNKVCGEPLFTLLKEIGQPEINQRPTPQQIQEALEIYRDSL